jgi:hypothetical protein
MPDPNDKTAATAADLAALWVAARAHADLALIQGWQMLQDCEALATRGRQQLFRRRREHVRAWAEETKAAIFHAVTMAACQIEAAEAALDDAALAHGFSAAEVRRISGIQKLIWPNAVADPEVKASIRILIDELIAGRNKV